MNFLTFQNVSEFIEKHEADEIITLVDRSLVHILPDLYVYRSFFNGLAGKNQEEYKCKDFVPANGLKLEEGKIISKIVADTGYDMIEMSGGGGDAMGSPKPYPSLVMKSSDEENYFLSSVQAIKPPIKNCKIVLMGGIRNPVIANELIQKNETNFISISRPLIYEPDIPNRWENGDFSKLKCTNCNSCYGTLYSGGLYCEVKRRKQS